jgi:hypothetical protein
MTKKLEELLNMPDSKEIIEESRNADKAQQAVVEQEETARSIQELDKITAALPQVKGLGEMADNELNEVSNKTNLDAKVAKLDKKLKMVELQLKKEKQDKDGSVDGDIVQGEGYVVTDRNSLLEKLKNMDK